MISVYAQGVISGEHFSPAAASSQLGLKFIDGVEPGEIMQSGRYRGNAAHSGRARLEVAGGSFDELLVELEKSVQGLRSCGASCIILAVDIEFEDQCNWEMSTEQIARLARCGIGMTVSCYERNSGNQ